MIYNPAITPDFYEKANAPVEHPWFEAGQPPVVLAVGRSNPVKGYDMLLGAFAQVISRFLVRLVILGEGDNERALNNWRVIWGFLKQ